MIPRYWNYIRFQWSQGWEIVSLSGRTACLFMQVLILGHLLFYFDEKSLVFPFSVVPDPGSKLCPMMPMRAQSVHAHYKDAYLGVQVTAISIFLSLIQYLLFFFERLSMCADALWHISGASCFKGGLCQWTLTKSIKCFSLSSSPSINPSTKQVQRRRSGH
jgi:hypothetical protein